MELEVLPKRLIIVGGGYIGLEFASMYASFGSQMTVLESFSRLMRGRAGIYRRLTPYCWPQDAAHTHQG